MSSLGQKLLVYVVLGIIIVAIPSVVIYLDYQNDVIANSNRYISYDITLNETDPQLSINIGEYPPFTEIQVYLNRTSSNNTDLVYFYLIEEPQLEGYLNGSISPEALTGAQVPHDKDPFWFNNSVILEGDVYLAFQSDNATIPVTIKGTYRAVPEGYFSRNAFQIGMGVMIYILVIFFLLPKAYRRYKINQFKRQKEQERIQEEEEFYRKYDQ